jgi:D-alanyl-D-alanine carboxypeptidase (penicillin-binding protein 5/6)
MTQPRGRAVTVVGLAVVTAWVLTALARPVPLPKVVNLLPQASTVAGPPPTLSWPATGEAAVLVPAAGFVATSPEQAPVPIASLVKIMTAFVVLKDHPLAPGNQGPLVEMGPADVADAAADARANDTSLPVMAGERLSELQLLEALLVHSASNVADTLARFDAGSVAGFVAKMNATARRLGLQATRYADPSGVSPQSVSTPLDQARLAALAMAIPTFAQVVGERQVTLPLAGTLENYVRSIGSDGIVGVKSGFTEAAQGCVVLAAKRVVAGQRMLVIAAVTGQGGAEPLASAEATARRLIDATVPVLRRVDVLTPGEPVARVREPWTQRSVVLRATRRAGALGWPGERVTMRVSVHARDALSGARRAGFVEVQVGSTRIAVPLTASGALPTPSLWWRIVHP